MSSSPDKSLFDLHSENQTQATNANNLRWSKYKKVLTVVPITVFILGLWYQYMNPNSLWNTQTGGNNMIPAASVPLTPEEQERRLDVAKQDGELLATQRAAEADANAKAAETARLVQAVTANLPTSVKVPRCSEEKTWSESITIPGDWSVKADWGGKHLLIQNLKDGEWQRQMTLKANGAIAAVRYCSTSTAQLELDNGKMNLTWRATN